MGWTFCPTQTLPDLIAERLREKRWTSEDGRNFNDKVIASSKRGNNLWYVVERTVNDGEPYRFIALDLLAYDRHHGAGYKDLCESMGPSEKNCPLKFFDLVPVPDGEYGKGWRERVREWHSSSTAERKRRAALNPKEGEKWRMKAGLVDRATKKIPLHTVRILSVDGKNIRGMANDGMVYSIAAKHLVERMGEKEVATLDEILHADPRVREN